MSYIPAVKMILSSRSPRPQKGLPCGAAAEPVRSAAGPFREAPERAARVECGPNAEYGASNAYTGLWSEMARAVCGV